MVKLFAGIVLASSLLFLGGDDSPIPGRDLITCGDDVASATDYWDTRADACASPTEAPPTALDNWEVRVGDTLEIDVDMLGNDVVCEGTITATAPRLISAASIDTIGSNPGVTGCAALPEDGGGRKLISFECAAPDGVAEVRHYQDVANGGTAYRVLYARDCDIALQVAGDNSNVGDSGVDFNVHHAVVRNGHRIFFDDTGCTAGCPGSIDLELQLLDAPEADMDCDLPALDGTGLIGSATEASERFSIEVETQLCSPSILGMDTFSLWLDANDQALDITGINGSERLVTMTGDVQVLTGGVHIQKSANLDFAGFDMVVAQGAFRIGDDNSTSTVRATFSGGELVARQVRLDDTDGAFVDFDGGGAFTVSGETEDCTGRTEYFADAATGTDSTGCGLSSGDPCETVDFTLSEISLLAAGADVCLRLAADQTHNEEGETHGTIAQDVWFGRYGTGADPVVQIDDDDFIRGHGDVRFYRQRWQTPPDVTPSFVAHCPGDIDGGDANVTCVGPARVIFDATGSDDALLTDDEEHTELLYFWDFGHDDGDWQEGARAGTSRPFPRRKEFGAIVGHEFPEGGPYTVTLEVVRVDGTGSALITGTVTVTSEDAAFPGNATDCIWVGAVAGSGDCPPGAATTAPGVDLGATLAAAGCLGAGAKRCLLSDAGGVYTMSTGAGSFAVSTNERRIHEVPGTSPVVNVSADINGFDGAVGAHNWWVRGIEFVYTGVSTDISGDLFTMGYGSRFAGVSETTIRGFDVAISRSVPATAVQLPDSPFSVIERFVWVRDNQLLEGIGNGGNDLFVSCYVGIIDGNRWGDRRDTAGGSELGREHGRRAKHQHLCHIGHNTGGRDSNAADVYGVGSNRTVETVRAGLATNMGAPSTFLCDGDNDPDAEGRPLAEYSEGWSSFWWAVDQKKLKGRLSRGGWAVQPTDDCKCWGGWERYVDWGSVYWTRFGESTSTDRNEFAGRHYRVYNGVYKIGAHAAYDGSLRLVSATNRARTKCNDASNACLDPAASGDPGVCDASDVAPGIAMETESPWFRNLTVFLDGNNTGTGDPVGVEISSPVMGVPRVEGLAGYDQPGNAQTIDLVADLSGLAFEANNVLVTANPFEVDPDESSGPDGFVPAAAGALIDAGESGLHFDLFGCEANGTRDAGAVERGGTNCRLE